MIVNEKMIHKFILQTNIAHILMKSKLILILFLLFSAINYSQNHTKIEFTENDKLIYLDSLGKISAESDHLYYRIIKDYKLDKASYQVYDFYKSGALYVSGISNSKDWVLKNGLFTSYYENGRKKTTANYVNRVIEGESVYWFKNGNKKSVSNYIKGKKEGEETQWYQNGNTKSVTNYKNGRIEGNVSRWYENGTKKLEEVCVYKTEKGPSDTSTFTTSEYQINQFWDENGVQKVIDGNGDYEVIEKNFKANGKLKKGYKDGVWKGYYLDYDYSYTETYNDEKLVSGIGVDKNKETHIYTEIVVKPKPKKGMDDFMSHISRNFQAPKVVGVSGKIYVVFFVEVDGTVEDIKVLRDLGQGTGEEAIRVVKSYSGWVPGELRGRKARISYSLPISLQTAK